MLVSFVRHTEGTFDPEVNRVPAGHSVAPGGGPAPSPGQPRAPGEDPRGSRRDDSAGVDSVVVAADDPAVLVAGTPPGAAQLDATGSVPGTFVATPAAGTIPGVGSGPVVTVTFTPAAATSTTTATAPVRIDVAAA